MTRNELSVSRGRLARDAILVVLLITDVWLVTNYLITVPFMWDGASYFRLDLSRLYESATTSLAAPQGFRYSPAIAQGLVPFGSLAWPVFAGLYTAAQVGALIFIGRRRWWMLGLFPPVLYEIWLGNIHILLAAAVVGGFRWPALWAFPLLTKVSPGVGLLWFVFRREWRSVGIALATTGAISAVSFALAPSLWFDWERAIVAMTQLPTLGTIVYPPVLFRLPVSIMILWVGAKTDRPWVVPLATMLALPSIWDISYSMLVASVGLAWYRPNQVQTGPPKTRPDRADSVQSSGEDSSGKAKRSSPSSGRRRRL